VSAMDFNAVETTGKSCRRLPQTFLQLLHFGGRKLARNFSTILRMLKTREAVPFSTRKGKEEAETVRP